MTIEATIIRTEPDSVYQGAVYDQTVVIELPDGTRFGLFDPDVTVGSKFIGQTVQLTVTVLVHEGGIERLTEGMGEIIPSTDNPLSWRNHVYVGRIDEFLSWSGNRREIQLDIGTGTIIVRPKQELIGELREGDILRIDASRSDVTGIETV
ncbi:hypothetical protein ACFQH6_18710 [Halobacteriaceae archaeon GCM10025711]